MQESLQVARQVGDTWLLSAILGEWGELALKQQRLDDAYAAFNEVLTISANSNQEAVAQARYGLARVAAARGDPANAYQLGKESLTLFESMGNRQTEEVKSWLQTIPGE
jgi:hypothetical protein